MENQFVSVVRKKGKRVRNMSDAIDDTITSMATDYGKRTFTQYKEFDPIVLKDGTKLPLMNLKGKPYLQVAHRLVWFRKEHPDWRIVTEIRNLADKAVIMHAMIYNAAGEVIATAHKKETMTGFGDYIEKAETGAVGRALAMCGYGTQFEPEFDEGDRLADAPVERQVKHAKKSE